MMKYIKNAALTLAILVLLYIALESMVLSLFVNFLPPIANPLLDNGIPILLQSSKQGLIPKHYIAIAGDSYAMGLGDQYYQEAGKAQAKYGSAPLIHEKTGKDVVSFGSAGNGSIAGMVSKPLSTLAYWKSNRRLSVADPDLLLVYFYEGNDLNDNVEYLQQASKKVLAFDYTQIHNSNYFQHYIEEVALHQDALYQQAQHLHWYDQLYLGKFVVHSSAALFSQLISQTETLVRANKKPEPVSTRSPLNPPGRFEWTEPGSINHALINGRDVQLPDKLQGPSMDLSPDEKDIALTSFQESLHYLKQHLVNTKIVVVYLPSVISSYDITSTQVSVQSHAKRKQFLFDTHVVEQQSDWIADHIQKISRDENITFVDARFKIHEASKTELLHGPMDWNHFNQAGYKILANAVTQEMN